MVLVIVRLLGSPAGRAHPCTGAMRGRHGRTCASRRRAHVLFPIYSSSLTRPGCESRADLGPDVEASTVLLIPRFTRVGAGAFLADDTMVAGYELGGGWLRVEHVRIGKHAFVGNSGMAAPGRKVPKQGLVAVLSAAPRRKKAKAGSSWLGSPPRPLRRDS